MTRALFIRSVAIMCVALGSGGLPLNARAADVTLHTGADAACRIMTDGRSQWCLTSFWRDQRTGDVFLFIADADRESGLEYASWE